MAEIRRRIAVAGLGMLMLLGVWSADAVGLDPPPLPTTTILPTTLPSISVPTTISTPSLPVPTPPAPTPPATTTQTTLPASPSTATSSTSDAAGGGSSSTANGGSSSGSGSSSSGATSSGGSSGSGSSSGAETASGGSTAHAAQTSHVTRARARRAWIARHGPAARRSTTLLLMLSRSGTVDIAVVQVAPVCKLWGHLRVRGHAGLNRVRFRGRVQGHVLPAGAYRLRARTAGSARVVVVKLLIVEQRLNEPLRAALAAAPCARAFARSGFGASAQGAFTAGRNAGSSVTRGGTASQEDAAVRSGGVLGADAVSGLTEARRAVPAALLVGLLAAAALLALVVLPDSAIPNARLASVVVDRRLELTLAGGALLAAVTIVYVVFGA